ncbi:hypothetical protein CEUSTIGMA_g9030.t1 [Chlamydomonas eustigma]|uniref:SET domain-containing protein n=1 Tax=Chlamydomonas eustigma TaxID=1157962 RepID=A0A250XFC5_9CHLO|nr:hypothetical protein CEUSTIGMA_g9030.t1 [Chlamydomonas eustigma]|eukprot:GAX81602.1 hypothetical protein CEUSTIGMA_g9030.t1 [Chlamydomonas eustigma]
MARNAKHPSCNGNWFKFCRGNHRWTHSTVVACNSYDRVISLRPCNTSLRVGDTSLGRGLVLERSVQKGDIILNVPTCNALVISDDPLEGISVFGDKNLENFQNKNGPLPGRLIDFVTGEERWDVRMTALLMWTWKIVSRKNEFWANYFTTVPSKEDLSCLLNYVNKEEEEELQLTELKVEALAQREWISWVHEKYFDPKTGQLGSTLQGFKGLTPADTFWAASLVRTRTFSCEASGEWLTVMVPYADLANHSFNNNATFELSASAGMNSEDGWFQFRCTSDHGIKEGDEATISYGPCKSNHELIRDYGFVVPGNPNDILSLPTLLLKSDLARKSVKPLHSYTLMTALLGLVEDMPGVITAARGRDDHAKSCTSEMPGVKTAARGRDDAESCTSEMPGVITAARGRDDHAKSCTSDMPGVITAARGRDDAKSCTSEMPGVITAARGRDDAKSCTSEMPGVITAARGRDDAKSCTSLEILGSSAGLCSTYEGEGQQAAAVVRLARVQTFLRSLLLIQSTDDASAGLMAAGQDMSTRKSVTVTRRLETEKSVTLLDLIRQSFTRSLEQTDKSVTLLDLIRQSLWQPQQEVGEGSKGSVAGYSYNGWWQASMRVLTSLFDRTRNISGTEINPSLDGDLPDPATSLEVMTSEEMSEERQNVAELRDALQKYLLGFPTAIHEDEELLSRWPQAQVPSSSQPAVSRARIEQAIRARLEHKLLIQTGIQCLDIYQSYLVGHRTDVQDIGKKQ